MQLTLLALLPLFTAAAGRTHEDRRSRHSQVARNVEARGTQYKIVDKFQGQNFLDNFDFFTGADPTGGLVDFLSEKDAKAAGLAYVQSDNTAVLAVDAKTKLSSGQNRKSVRISTKKTYDSGLFVADFFAAPHGCGSWPAYWSLGTDAEWPLAGEIDIMESIHNASHNQMTMHTGPSCKWETNAAPLLAANKKAFTGQLLGSTCASSPDANAGCGVSDTRNTSFGHLFNQQAGGVFVHEISSKGVALWYFDRDAVPGDLQAETPDPNNWPPPTMFLSSAGCDIASNFHAHSLILDITLCGSWAGDPNVYAQSGCQAVAPTCADAVANPDNFANAQFKINHITVYQSQ